MQQGKGTLGTDSKVAFARQGQPQHYSAWPGGDFSQRSELVIARRRYRPGKGPEEMLTRLIISLESKSCKKRKSKSNLSRAGREKP